MTDAEFLRNFKKHLRIFRKRISKGQVLENLQKRECPFRLPKFNNRLRSNFLGLSHGKIVNCFQADMDYVNTANYSYSRLTKKMIEIVKATRWKDK